MRRLHIHRDRNYQLHGANYYFECKCGARRVKRAFTRLAGPVEPGWPYLVNSHGTPVNDTGWRKR